MEAQGEGVGARRGSTLDDVTPEWLRWFSITLKYEGIEACRRQIGFYAALQGVHPSHVEQAFLVVPRVEVRRV